jgi:hypothetical protein
MNKYRFLMIIDSMDMTADKTFEARTEAEAWVAVEEQLCELIEQTNSEAGSDLTRGDFRILLLPAEKTANESIGEAGTDEQRRNETLH